MHRPILIPSLIAAALALPAVAAAQDYPTRPVKVITNTSAGGISDIFMRALGDELQKRWGQPLIVENRPGGMQNIGAARVLGGAARRLYHLHRQRRADGLQPVSDQDACRSTPRRRWQPITNLYQLIQTMVVNSSLNVKTVGELIALSKAKPKTLNYVTAAVPLALYMETLVKEQGADWVRVPFKGGGEAVNAVLSGSTPIALIGEGNVIGNVRAGKMTALVMVNNIRSPNFPSVPTLEETGYKGAPSRSWYGLFTQPGTPKPIVDKIAKDVAAIVNDPAFRERHLTARSLVPAINGPEQFAAEIKKDRATAEQVVKASGLTPQ